MALAAPTLWHVIATATASMLNGGGFNTGNANFLTDGTVDTNTGNTSAPVFSSASYTFVAGDVGARIFVAAGTNCIPGLYYIASVSGGKATLSAAIGAATIADIYSGEYEKLSTAAGIATVGTPTGITFGVDYSTLTAAALNITDLACTTPSTTVTSATGGFTRVMVGNVLNITAITGTGTLTGRYEIVSFTDANTVVLDRTPAPTNNATAGTIYVGGALDFTGSGVDTFYEAVQAGNSTWVKTGTYTMGASVSIASMLSTDALHSRTRSFTAVPGDTCTGENRPLFAMASNSFSFGQNSGMRGFIFTGTGTTLFSTGAAGLTEEIKAINSSTTAGRTAILVSAASRLSNCEAVSLNGIAINNSGGDPRIIGCSAHDSASGFAGSSSREKIRRCIIWACTTAALNLNSPNTTGDYEGNTLYGGETPFGTGILIAANATRNTLANNIIYGFTTGIAQTTAQLKSNRGNNNVIYNCTTNASNYYLNSENDVTTVNPSLGNPGQLTGSTATIAGGVLTQTGAFASNVTDGESYLHVLSGSGATVGIYGPISSHDSNSVTVPGTIGTNATPDKVWRIHYGTTFAPTGAV